jgi:hypothetical protein
MTAAPRKAGDPQGWAIPDSDVADGDTNVLALAGRQPPGGRAWLQVTTAEARRGGEFTALFLPRRRSAACGGDVLVRIAPREPAAGDAEPATAVAGAEVQAVAVGSLVRVAGWDPVSLDLWPEIVRTPVVFALGALRELQGHGADAGSRDEGGHRPAPALSLVAAGGAMRPGQRRDGTAPGSPGTRPHGRAARGQGRFTRRPACRRRVQPGRRRHRSAAGARRLPAAGRLCCR